MALAKVHTVGNGAVGTIQPHHSNASAPAGWLLCDGAALSRATYPALFSALTFTRTVNTTSGSSVVTSTNGTVPVWNGGWVEIAGAIVGTTVASGGGTSSLTLAANATATLTGATMRVIPFGAPNATDFNAPNLRGRVPKFMWNAGHRGGRGAVTVTSTHMPPHSHGVTDPGHGHTITNGASHYHGLNGDPWGVRVGYGVSWGSASPAAHVAYTNGAVTTFAATSVRLDTAPASPFPAQTNYSGSDVEHTNIQPTLAAAYIVRALP